MYQVVIKCYKGRGKGLIKGDRGRRGDFRQDDQLKPP